VTNWIIVARIGHKRSNDCPGAPLRRKSPPTYSDLVKEAPPHYKPTLLRLLVQEAWQLSTDEGWVRNCQLSHEGGTVNFLYFPVFNGYSLDIKLLMI